MSDVEDKTAVDISKATPRPWTSDTPEGRGTWIKGSIAGQSYSALSCGESNDEANANAALIVRAVNHHDELVAALRDVTNFAEAQICTHENTRRGGVIWTICDDCGAKFADDEGGPPTPKVFKPIARARALLSKVSEQ